MALHWRIKAAVVGEDGGREIDVSEAVIGKVRLWVQETGLPSDKFLVYGDWGPTTGDRIKTRDKATFDTGIDRILARSGVTVADYGPRWRFSADVFVPQSLIDGYAG